MRICLVSLRALPALSEAHKYERLGGEEVQHALLSKALVKRGHDVRLVVADFGQPDGAVYEGVTTLKAFKESAGIPGLRFVPRWVALWDALKRADAEVYYYSCAGMALGLLALFCKKYGRRLVYRVARDDDCDISKVVLGLRDRELYAYGLKRADSILVQTVSQQQAMWANFKLPSTVAGMLVEPPGPPTAKDIDVLWVANLHQVKRPDRLLHLAWQMPNVNFHMAGAMVPGGEALYRQIEAEAKTLRNVTFHGQVPYRDIGKLFDRARVFANTSELEGFPNTFLQSWIRGIPVVTMFDPDGLVKSEGLGSSHDSVRGMVDGLQEMLRSPGEASTAARRFMEERYEARMVLGPYLHAMGAHATVMIDDIFPCGPGVPAAASSGE